MEDMAFEVRIDSACEEPPPECDDHDRNGENELASGPRPPDRSRCRGIAATCAAPSGRPHRQPDIVIETPQGSCGHIANR
jgi:hypothetical protein